MIYIVRHGETPWNVEKIYQGNTDVPLNDKGKEQAGIVKEKLNDIKFDIIFSSPLQRAYDTARIIVGDDEEIITDDRLRERCLGELEGNYYIDYENKVSFEDYNERKYSIEPLADFENRVYDFLSFVVSNYKDKNVLIATHGLVSIYVKFFFEGKPNDDNYHKYILSNCQILKYPN